MTEQIAPPEHSKECLEAKAAFLNAIVAVQTCTGDHETHRRMRQARRDAGARYEDAMIGCPADPLAGDTTD